MSRKPSSMYRYVRGQPSTRKEYMGGIPNPRITQFVLGNKTDKFPVMLTLNALERCHVRHNALESARITVNRAMEKKVGSANYPKLKASVNEAYCPTLKDKVDSTMIPNNVGAIYELVLDGLSLDAIKKAMAAGIDAASRVDNIVKIKAADYGGNLGPIKLYLKDVLT